MITTLLKSIWKREFLRHLSFSLTGTAAGQFIVLLGTLLPVMSLYDAGAIGDYGIFFSISLILALVATGRYEMVIPIAGDERTASALVPLAGGLGVCTAVLTTIVLAVWTPPWLAELGWAIWLLPIQVVLGSWANTLRLWLSCRSRFDRIAFAEIARAATMIGLQWGLASQFDNGPVGLVVGFTGGWAVYVGVTGCGSGALASWQGWGDSRRAAVMYSHNLFLLLSQSINACSAYAPIFFFRGVFSEAAAGFFFITLTFLYKPLAFLGQSVQQVFFPVAARQVAQGGQCGRLFNQVVGGLLLAGICIFLPITVLAPWLLEWVSTIVDDDPGKWSGAGAMITVLAPFCIVKLLSSVVVGMWIISGRQAWDVAWQAIFLVAVLGGLSVGWSSGDPMASVWGYAITTTIAFAINLACCWFFACGHGHRAAMAPAG
jgi:hypothetical protein